MNAKTAFIRDRGMSLSEYDWVLVQTALLKYGNDLIESKPDQTGMNIAIHAINLAKDIRFTEDSRNMQQDLDSELAL